MIDARHETPALGQRAAVILRKQLLDTQGAKVDTVSGASITSGAVQKAAAKCVAQAKGEIPVEVITAEASNESTDKDWLGKPPEIDEKDIVQTKTTDILVIGCGTGGLIAVSTAAENGADVIVLDRHRYPHRYRRDRLETPESRGHEDRQV